MSKKIPASQRYVLSKEYRKLAWALNNALNEFSDMGVKTNKTRLFEQTLENFYEKNKLKVANPKRITLQKYMTESQVTELSDIVMSFAEEPQGLVFEEYKQKFDSIDKVIAEARIIGGEENFNVDRFLTFQDQFGVRNYQEFIDVIDALNNRKTDALLNDIQDSDQIAELAAYGHTKGLTNEDIELELLFRYQFYGLHHENLYNKIIDEIGKL